MYASLLSAGLILTGCSGDFGNLTGSDEKEENKQEETQNEKVNENETNENDSTDFDEALSQEVIDEIKEDRSALEEEVEELQDERDYYKKYVVQLYNQLSEKKQKILLNKEWNYNLEVNGVSFPPNGVMEVKGPRLEVILSEERVPYSVLPKEESDQARLSTGIKSGFMFKNGTESFEAMEEVNDDETSHRIMYVTDGVQEDEEFEITITDSLRERLGLETGELKIIIR